MNADGRLRGEAFMVLFQVLALPFDKGRREMHNVDIVGPCIRVAFSGLVYRNLATE
jgi:hypothetical protein